MIGRRRHSLATLAFFLISSTLAFAVGTAAAEADDAATESRLQRLEAESKIRNLLDRYMDLLESRDWDDYMMLFTRDGELDMDEGVVKGRDAIRNRMANASARMASAAQGRPQRQRADLLSNIRVSVDGDRATARSRFTFVAEQEDGRFMVTGSGLYVDTLAREEDQWKIARRIVRWDLLRGASASTATTAD
jgi:3-phenylpropionate/cinnamic acid dioxygenase small subunit